MQHLAAVDARGAPQPPYPRGIMSILVRVQVVTELRALSHGALSHAQTVARWRADDVAGMGVCASLPVEAELPPTVAFVRPCPPAY